MLTWREIPGFALKVNVQAFLRSTSYQYGTLKKLATSIFDRYIKSKDFDAALQTYLDTCYTIDRVKIATTGRNAPTNRSNILMQAIAAIFVTEACLSDEHIAKINTLIESLQGKTGTQTWFYPKLESLKMFATYAKLADQLACSVSVRPEFGERALELIRASVGDAAKQATDMMHELAVLKKYGVKSSFFQDGLMHEPSQAWVFMDFHEIRKFLSEYSTFLPTPPLALVGLSDRKDLMQIGVEPHQKREGEGILMGVQTLFPAHIFMCMDAEGELDASLGLGLMPLRTFFARRGKEAFYEYLRLAQALRLYDLVVPLVTVAKMPKLTVPMGIFQRVKSIITRKARVLNPDLIIPRLRTLENVDRLIRELEIEVEQADEETVQRAKRQMGRHEVIYHVRKLPEGKHPTREARARAEEYGIVLAENETFVRPHERGKGDLSTAPHRAKIRKTPK